MLILRVRVELVWRDWWGHGLPLLVELHHLVVVVGVHALQVGLVAEAPPAPVPVFPVIVFLPRSVPLLSGPLPLVDWLLLETSPTDAVVMGLRVVGLTVHVVGLFVILIIAGVLCPI